MATLNLAPSDLLDRLGEGLVRPGINDGRKNASSSADELSRRSLERQCLAAPLLLFSRSIADSFDLCSRLVLIVTPSGPPRGHRLHAALTIRDERARSRHFQPCHRPRDRARIENGDSSRLCSPDAPKVNVPRGSGREPIKEVLPFMRSASAFGGRLALTRRQAKKMAGLEPGHPHWVFLRKRDATRLCR